ncbi:MAG: PAS domain-containing protein [Bryobacterales bacterium]|nr:PAS domain-containing protein [Bryobacterales bacterium]
MSSEADFDFHPVFPYEPDEQIVVGDISEATSESISVEVLAHLLDLAPLQVLIKDKSGKYVYLNRSIRKGLNGAGRDPIGMSDQEATPIAAQVAAWREAEAACMATGRINENNVVWTDRQKKNHVNQVLNVPLSSKDDGVVGVAVIATDITYRAVVKASEDLLQLLQHDWVKNLLSGLINRIDESLRTPQGATPSGTLAGYSLEQLRLVFEFMESYLVSLPSILSGYTPGNGDRRVIMDFGSEVIAYMQKLAPLIQLDVTLRFEPNQTFFLRADQKCLRVMCYELMRNHQKYGVGDVLTVAISEIGHEYVKVAFQSPGEKHRIPTAYAQIGTKGLHMPTYDSEGNEKDPKGLGSGMYFCHTLALAHNDLNVSDPERYRGVVYGAEFDEGLYANVFWFRFPKVTT